jgi:uncharacterized protein (DUF1330 family)
VLAQHQYPQRTGGEFHEEGDVFMNANPTDPDKFAAFQPLSLKAMKHTVVSFWCVGEGARRLKNQCAYPGSYSSSLTPFVDDETATKWNHSAQYEAARHVRAGAAELNMMVVEGL